MGKALRTGLTTGCCASAAAAAAVEAYFGSAPEKVEVTLPNGKKIRVDILSIEKDERGDKKRVIAKVKKDAGDDPDITNGAIIGVSLLIDQREVKGVDVQGGVGVGKVTRQGLPVPVGQYAINPVPNNMIKNEVLERLGNNSGKAFVTVFVENGEVLAQKTLNPRLGIVGGISILGTTGIVKPFSADSYRDTIKICLNSASLVEPSLCVLSTGRGSEKKIALEFSSLRDPSFILIADFFAFSIKEAVKKNFTSIKLSCFFGKLCKWAMRLEYTHAHTKETDFSLLADFAREEGLSEDFCIFVRQANTAREIYESNRPDMDNFINMVGKRALDWARSLSGSEVEVAIYCWQFKGSGFLKWC